jgi:hypothetical protein
MTWATPREGPGEGLVMLAQLGTTKRALWRDGHCYRRDRFGMTAPPMATQTGIATRPLLGRHQTATPKGGRPPPKRYRSATESPPLAASSEAWRVSSPGPLLPAIRPRSRPSPPVPDCCDALANAANAPEIRHQTATKPLLLDRQLGLQAHSSLLGQRR